MVFGVGGIGEVAGSGEGRLRMGRKIFLAQILHLLFI